MAMLAMAARSCRSAVGEGLLQPFVTGDGKTRCGARSGLGDVERGLGGCGEGAALAKPPALCAAEKGGGEWEPNLPGNRGPPAEHGPSPREIKRGGGARGGTGRRRRGLQPPKRPRSSCGALGAAPPGSGSLLGFLWAPVLLLGKVPGVTGWQPPKHPKTQPRRHLQAFLPPSQALVAPVTPPGGGCLGLGVAPWLPAPKLWLCPWGS